MTLENLLNSGQLKKHPTDRAEIQQLLESALRNLADAKVTEISLENRFDGEWLPTRCQGSSSTDDPDIAKINWTV